jgi:uncharacterized DUF497 family protein
MIRIAELEFDDYNIEELAAHGITATEIMQLLENTFTVRRNRKAKAGDRQMIGYTHGGRVLTVVLASTPVPGRWRPVTGWLATDSERRALV